MEPTRSRLRGALWAGGLIVLMGLNPARLYAQLTPIVKTAFVLEASAYDDIAPERRSQIEANLSAYMAERLTDHFSYLRWFPPSNPEADSAQTSFTISAYEKPIGTDSVFWDIELDYVARVETDTTNRNLSGFLDNTILFKFYETKYTDNPEMLQTKILDKLKAQIASESFRKMLHEYFLGDIALSKDIDVDINKDRLIVPIHWDELKADSETTLRAQFQATHDNQVDSGNMAMRLDAPKTVMPWTKPVLYCIIKNFEFPAFNWPPDSSGIQGTIIPEILNKTSRKWIRIYMDEYKKSFNAGTAAGLVVDNNVVDNN